MKIISQNMWNVNPPLDEDMSAFVALCHHYKPDILLLQENSFSDALKTDVAPAVTDRLGMNYWSRFHAGTWCGRDEGSAVITRAQHIVELYVALSKGTNEMGRCLASATLPIGSTRLHLATIYLDRYLKDNAGHVIPAQESCEALRWGC